jgi:hypothetical protein
MAQLPLMHKSDRLEEFPLQGKNEHRFSTTFDERQS